MDNDSLFSAIQDYVAYAKLWHCLEKSHTDDQLNVLMLKTIEIEEQVLSHFGLPNTFYYSDLFQMLGLKDDFKLADITSLLSDLELEAQKYLSGPVLTDWQLLSNAQEALTIIDEVLPELSIPLKPEPYYIFLYDDLLLVKLISPSQFLEEIRYIHSHGISLLLNKFAQNADLISALQYKQLVDHKLRYFAEFERRLKEKKIST